MAGRSRSGDRDDGVTVSFGAKFARSDQFKTVFREGMALVEAAAELDESLRRRRDAQRLTRGSEPPVRRSSRDMETLGRFSERRTIQEGAQ